jgi:hypothetical protein
MASWISIDKRFDINIVEINQNMTPIMYLLDINYIDIISEMINNGVLLNYQDIYGGGVGANALYKLDEVAFPANMGKYGYVNGNETVFFNTNGLSYLLEKKHILTEHDREEVEHGHKLKDKPELKAKLLGALGLDVSHKVFSQTSYLS